jgi:hypothetical protein
MMASRTPARVLVLGWMMVVEPVPVLMASTPLSNVVPGAMPAELSLTACASCAHADAVLAGRRLGGVARRLDLGHRAGHELDGS